MAYTKQSLDKFVFKEDLKDSRKIFNIGKTIVLISILFMFLIGFKIWGLQNYFDLLDIVPWLGLGALLLIVAETEKYVFLTNAKKFVYTKISLLGKQIEEIDFNDIVSLNIDYTEVNVQDDSSICAIEFNEFNGDHYSLVMKTVSKKYVLEVYDDFDECYETALKIKDMIGMQNDIKYLNPAKN